MERALEEARERRALAPAQDTAQVELLSGADTADSSCAAEGAVARVQLLLRNERVRAAAAAKGCVLSEECVRELVNPGFSEVWEDDVEVGWGVA